jgi:hypothetical protein
MPFRARRRTGRAAAVGRTCSSASLEPILPTVARLLAVGGDSTITATLALGLMQARGPEHGDGGQGSDPA